MSNSGVRGIVVAHGAMATGLVDAVRSIADIEDDVLIPVSNRGLSPQALADSVREATGGATAIVFTDLPSGSCGFAARMLIRNTSGVAVVCGVNLAMLLDFVTNRDMDIDPLLERLVSRARASIQSVPVPAPRHGDPAVQG
jgi:mannose/fructose-specific phosphotransferase system component IIA